MPTPRAENEMLSLPVVLDWCQVVLANMARENERTGWFWWLKARWPIAHEPLRSDARCLLPHVERALLAAKTKVEYK